MCIDKNYEKNKLCGSLLCTALTCFFEAKATIQKT